MMARPMVWWADFTFVNDEKGSNTVIACTMDYGLLPESYDDADHVSDSLTKILEEDEVAVAMCRQQTVYLFDEALVLFETDGDGSLLNEDQLRLVRSDTSDGDDGVPSETSEVLALGQEGFGGLSVLGTGTTCDDQDAHVLLLDADGDEVLRLSGEGDPVPDLERDEENGIFLTRANAEPAPLRRSP